jgi:CheY-like chemotaxis protein
VIESILVVDDEKPVRYMLRRLLEGNGYAVTEADSAEQALEVIGNARADLVITDLKMPGMDGLAMAQVLLKQEPSRPVLMMTAYADLESARRAVAVGIYEYFIKPVDVSDVLAGVQRALEHRKLVLENRDYQRDLERRVEERTHELRLKVAELEARDRLLSHMLSIHEPEETLGLAVGLALDLCDCDAGVLFVPDAEGTLVPRVAVGYEAGDQVTTGDALAALALGDAVSAAALCTATESGQACVRDPGPVRTGFGIHSFAALAVRRGDTLIAVLEVGRKRKDTLVGDSDLASLTDFLGYIAMALADCQLQEQMPEWGEDLGAALDATDDWTKE